MSNSNLAWSIHKAPHTTRCTPECKHRCKTLMQDTAHGGRRPRIPGPVVSKRYFEVNDVSCNPSLIVAQAASPATEPRKTSRRSL